MRYITLALLALTLASCKHDTEADWLKHLEEQAKQESSVKGLFVNEVVSNAAEGDDWVELYNSTDKEIDLSGFQLQDDGGAAKAYTLPAGTKIAAKGYVVFERAQFGFGLSSGGDLVTLLDTKSVRVDEIRVPAMATPGQSYGRATDGSSEWKVIANPSKSKANGAPDPTARLLVNEVVSNPAVGSGDDWIELYNGTDKEIDLSGFQLQDDGGAAKGYTIPAGTKIAAKGFLVFEKGTHFTFGLSSSGDKVVLLNNTAVLLQEVVVPAMPDAGKSYARIGATLDWKIFDLPTKGASNK